MAVKAIYVLRDPITDEIRYVGATSDPLWKRLALHVTLSRDSTTKCAAWIRDVVACGGRPTIDQVMSATESWERAETETIALLRSEGADLLNMTAGGMGCTDCLPSDEARAKRSATLKKHYAGDPEKMLVRQQMARDAARSPNGRRAASERMKALWADPVRSAEVRARISNTMKAKR